MQNPNHANACGQNTSDDEEFFRQIVPGYRFRPTDDELIEYYLIKKINNEQLPRNRIHCVHLYESNPFILTETYVASGENEWYFFTPRTKKYRNGSRPDRASDGGYWKVTGAKKSIIRNGREIGFKSSLVHYIGNHNEGHKSSWLMEEYMVKDPPVPIQTTSNDMKLDEWVLCKIHKKHEGCRQNNSSNNNNRSNNSEINKDNIDEGVEESKMQNSNEATTLEEKAFLPENEVKVSYHNTHPQCINMSLFNRGESSLSSIASNRWTYNTLQAYTSMMPPMSHIKGQNGHFNNGTNCSWYPSNQSQASIRMVPPTLSHPECQRQASTNNMTPSMLHLVDQNHHFYSGTNYPLYASGQSQVSTSMEPQMLPPEGQNGHFNNGVNCSSYPSSQIQASTSMGVPQMLHAESQNGHFDTVSNCPLYPTSRISEPLPRGQNGHFTSGSYYPQPLLIQQDEDYFPGISSLDTNMIWDLDIVQQEFETSPYSWPSPKGYNL